MPTNFYNVITGPPLENQLNTIFADLSDRLDRIEGTRGTTVSDSNILTNAEPFTQLVFHSQSIVVKGSSDPGRDSTTGLLEFDASSTEEIAGVAMVPRQWKEGSSISPVVHWSKTTAATGTVLWQWRYRWANMGLDTSAWSDWLAAAEIRNAGAVADRHARSDLPDFTVSAETGAVIHWGLRRVGGSDSYGADVQLYAFSLNLKLDRIGSTTEFAK
jgi:hypothetical protein